MEEGHTTSKRGRIGIGIRGQYFLIDKRGYDPVILVVDLYFTPAFENKLIFTIVLQVSY